MITNKQRNVFFVVFFFLFHVNLYASPVEIPFWHSLSGRLGKTLTALSNEFNKTQTAFKINPIYKGTYPELFTGFVAAYKANLHPPLVQIQEISTATMLENSELIIPLYQLMKRFPEQHFNNEYFFPALRNYYGDNDKQLYALPFNSSSAVLYYNKTLFDKAGINLVPSTWEQVEQVSQRLRKKGLTQCGFTTSYPSWVNIETFTQWHGISILTQKDHNHPLEVNYHSPALSFHLNQLFKWHKEGLFQYAGRDSNATALFISGKCPMFITSSGSYASLKKEAQFDVDVASLPYWPKYRNKTYNGLIGGAALWVINHFDSKTYEGIALFFAFLSQEEKQAFWQEETGYFSVLAKSLTHKKKKLSTLKASNIALAQISHEAPLLQGIRLPNYFQIRLFNDEQIEGILSELLTVDEALSQSNDYANKRLMK